jgi:hypothetical protein
MRRRREALQRRWVDPQETATSPPNPDERKIEEAIQHYIRELPLGIRRVVAGIGVEGAVRSRPLSLFHTSLGKIEDGRPSAVVD